MGLRLIQYRGKKNNKKTKLRTREHLILLPCLTLKLHVLGLKSEKSGFFPPYIHIYKPECSMVYKLGFKKEL